jgi:hypothetical protein
VERDRRQPSTNSRDEMYSSWRGPSARRQGSTPQEVSSLGDRRTIEIPAWDVAPLHQVLKDVESLIAYQLALSLGNANGQQPVN